MAGTSPQPVAQGTLAETPLAHVFLSVVDRGMSGTLAVWPDEPRPGQERFLFDAGRLVSVRLVGEGSDLEQAVLAVFKRTKAPYAFYEGDLVTDKGVVYERDVWGLVASATRLSTQRRVVEEILSKLGDGPLTLRDESQLARFDFTPQELSFVALLKHGTRSAAELVADATDGSAARRLLYLLALTKLLDRQARKPSVAMAVPKGMARQEVEAHVAQQSPASKPPAPRNSFPELPGLASEPPKTRPMSVVSAPPARLPDNSLWPRLRLSIPEMPQTLAASEVARWNQVVERAQKIEDQTYFDMLEVTPNTSTEDVKTAYYRLAKVWHPDRTPASLDALRPLMERVFRYLTEAHDTLTDMQSRGPYLRSVQSGGGTPASDHALRVVLEAAMQFQKVDVLVRTKDFDTAAALIEEILRLAPNEADYQAARGEIAFRREPGNREVWFRAMQDVEKALLLNPRNERGLRVKAELLQRMGRDTDAFEIWRQILEYYPKNVEAQRMVRLADMRSNDKGKATDGGTGLLSKLLGKNKK